jgi:hypothetical protein
VSAGEVQFERAKKKMLAPLARKAALAVWGSLDMAMRRNRRCIQLWNISTGHLLHAFEDHERLVMSLAVSANGRRLISGHEDGCVMVWGLPE